MSEKFYNVPIRIAIGGSVDAGKSSLLGVLKTNVLDDGKGKARKNIFNYPHEIKTGRTSSIAQRSINVNDKKVIFYDLAGHEKYLRTTLFGLSSSYPNIAFILIESNKGVQPMTKEHIKCAIYLRIPIVFIITKLDISIPNKLRQNIRKLKKNIKRNGKIIFEINSVSDMNNITNKISSDCFPLFKISVVDEGFNLNLLKKFISNINVIKKKINNEENKNKELFFIDKSFRTEGYPLIASGIMRDGKISVGDKLFLGPYGANDYVCITVRSIHDDDRNNVSYLRKGELGCIAFNSKTLKNKKQIKPGMIISSFKRNLVSKFVGKVNVFSNNACTINIGYNTLIHCGCLKKSVRIYMMETSDGKKIKTIRGGDKNINIYFEFLKGKHFLEIGERFLFREGATRGFGHIKEFI